MSGDDKQLKLEALAAVGEMLLFDRARGNPEEAARILRCARQLAAKQKQQQANKQPPALDKRTPTHALDRG